MLTYFVAAAVAAVLVDARSLDGGHLLRAVRRRRQPVLDTRLPERDRELLSAHRGSHAARRDAHRHHREGRCICSISRVAVVAMRACNQLS